MTGFDASPPPPPAPPPPPPPWPSPGDPSASPYPAYGAQPARSTNGFAIASLVCSLVACGIGSLLAIVFGHIARGQIRRTGEGGNGLAIAGLVIGYLGIAAIAVFMAVAIFAVSVGLGEHYASDEARDFERRVVGYARLAGTTARDARAINRSFERECCGEVTIGNTGVDARGATTSEFQRGGWQLQFHYVGTGGSGPVCLTIPDGVTVRRSDVRDVPCDAPTGPGV